MAVPYTFGSATSSIPLSQLDSNFATGITLGNTTVYLGNTTTSFGNVTLTNVTISSVAAAITPSQGGTGLVTIPANNVILGNGTSNVTVVAPGTSGNVLTSNGTTWSSSTISAASVSAAGSTTQVQYNNAGAFAGSANLTFNGTTLTAAGLSGPFNGTVGATTPSTGAFTTLSASSTVSGTGFSTYLASPPAIGGTAPAAGAFTTLTATTAIGTSSGGTGLTSFTSGGVVYASSTSALATGSALTFDGTSLDLGTVGAKVNFATTGSATRNYVGGSADGYSLEMVTQRGASQPLSYKQDYSVGHVWSVAGSTALTLNSTSLYTASGINVGIGTSNPQRRLDAQSTTADYQLRLGYNSSFYYDIGRVNSNGYLGFYGSQTNATGFTFGGVDGTRMTLDSSGNLLVHASGTDPYSTSGGYGIALNGSADYIAVARSGGAAIYAARQGSNGSLAEWWCQGNSVGSISVTTTLTSYNVTSDYRLKNTIAPMTGALAKVALLKPVTYKWNFDGSNCEGFIAHELAEVVPYAVTGEKDAVDADGKPQYQGIDVSFLVATLTAAIQEQQAIIESLKARLDAANL